jgi:hypothetical protein
MRTGSKGMKRESFSMQTGRREERHAVKEGKGLLLKEIVNLSHAIHSLHVICATKMEEEEEEEEGEFWVERF